MRANSSRIGAAGAFQSAAQLAERGWDASLTLGNAPRTDIVAQHARSQRLIAVQCKTTATSQGFLLSTGCESPSAAGRDEWFILVHLHSPDARPDFYVVPRNVVAAYIYVGHRAWLTGTSKFGKAHQPSSMRVVEERAIPHYKERWDLLLGPANAVPYWLPDWVFGWAEETGLPEGHPGLERPDDGPEPPPAEAWVPHRPAPV